jgi:prepilin-type N-terminal cleavage/methylation domain-containing protein
MNIKKQKIGQHNAFTMLELVFVIIVLGILAAMALPRLESDTRQEAQNTIVSALRYTKNLALSDDKTDPRDPNWQKELWQLRFAQSSTNKWFFTISSDLNHLNNVNKTETFVDPLNGKYMYHLAGDSSLDETDESPNIFLSKRFGIDSIVFSGDAICAGNQHIAFDNLGRPHSSLGTATHLFTSYLKTNCNIIIGFEDPDITDINITIQTETGHISAS